MVPGENVPGTSFVTPPTPFSDSSVLASKMGGLTPLGGVFGRKITYKNMDQVSFLSRCLEKG